MKSDLIRVVSAADVTMSVPGSLFLVRELQSQGNSAGDVFGLKRCLRVAPQAPLAVSAKRIRFEKLDEEKNILDI